MDSSKNVTSFSKYFLKIYTYFFIIIISFGKNRDYLCCISCHHNPTPFIFVCWQVNPWFGRKVNNTLWLSNISWNRIIGLPWQPATLTEYWVRDLPRTEIPQDDFLYEEYWHELLWFRKSSLHVDNLTFSFRTCLFWLANRIKKNSFFIFIGIGLGKTEEKTETELKKFFT